MPAIGTGSRFGAIDKHCSIGISGGAPTSNIRSGGKRRHPSNLQSVGFKRHAVGRSHPLANHIYECHNNYGGTWEDCSRQFGEVSLYESDTRRFNALVRSLAANHVCRNPMRSSIPSPPWVLALAAVAVNRSWGQLDRHEVASGGGTGIRMGPDWTTWRAAEWQAAGQVPVRLLHPVGLKGGGFMEV